MVEYSARVRLTPHPGMSAAYLARTDRNMKTSLQLRQKTWLKNIALKTGAIGICYFADYRMSNGAYLPTATALASVSRNQRYAGQFTTKSGMPFQYKMHRNGIRMASQIGPDGLQMHWDIGMVRLTRAGF